MNTSRKQDQTFNLSPGAMLLILAILTVGFIYYKVSEFVSTTSVSENWSYSDYGIKYESCESECVWFGYTPRANNITFETTFECPENGVIRNKYVVFSTITPNNRTSISTNSEIIFSDDISIHANTRQGAKLIDMMATADSLIVRMPPNEGVCEYEFTVDTKDFTLALDGYEDRMIEYALEATAERDEAAQEQAEKLQRERDAFKSNKG